MSSADHGPRLPDLPPESRPVRLAARLSSLVWWSLLTVLILFALYAGIGRQLTQNIDSFRDDLELELSARTGKQVEIGALDARWNWLDPTLLARDIEVVEPGTGDYVARLQHLRIRLDFLASLFRFRVVFKVFEADGLELTLNQTPDGEVGVEGADLPEPARREFRDWLELAGRWLSDPYIKLTRVNLAIRDNQDQLRHLEIPQLDLVYYRGLFRASGRAMQPGTTQQLASFNLVGRQFFRGGFTGQLYLDVASGRLFDGLIDEYQWRTLRVEGFDLGGQLWLTFRDGLLQQANGSVQTPYLQLGVGTESLAPIEDISARFGWRRSEKGGDAVVSRGEFHLQELQWTWNDITVPPFSMRLMPRDSGDVEIVADALPIGPLRRLLAVLPLLPERAGRALENYRPRGYLDRLHLRLPAGDWAEFELTGLLRDVRVQAHGGAPGGAGLNGRISLRRYSGSVELMPTEEPVSLGFPRLFNGDWLFREASGTVAWLMDGPITRVYSDNIRMSYGAETTLTGAFDLRMDREGEDNLGLRVGVKGGRADMLADFVPAKVVNPGLYDWLTTAITEARITEGVYYGHGQIGRGAPRGSFVSSMWYTFEDATVRYDERWPEVTSANGRVDIHNGDTEVQLVSGRTGGLELRPSRVRVVPGDDTRLYVDAAAKVAGDAVPFWMENSPLGEMAGTAARSLVYGGEYALDLDLELPLGAAGEPVVQARIRTDDGSVRYPQANLSWTDLSGDLTYHTVEGFSGGPLNALFFGDPVAVSLSVGPDGQGLAIRQDGQLTVPEVFRQAGLESDSSFGLRGTLNYSAGLTVGADTTSGIRVSSDLEGLAVDWPQPLAKSADEQAPLEATIDAFAEEGVRIAGSWENRMGFDFLWHDTGFDLMLGHLYLGPHTLRNIEINALELEDRWVVSTRSERAIGRVVLPDGAEPVKADFEVLRLVRDDEQREAQPELLTLDEQLEAFRALDMGSWPDIDVSISDLQLNDETVGAWSFRLRPEPFQLKVNTIEGRLNSLTLLGDMTWSIASDREVTRFAGSVTGGALTDLNQLFGTEIPLENQQTNIELDLDWPGRPDDFSMREVSGTVSLRLDDGIILEQNSTAQLFRIFNLLNADTLWRRLQLDFSDLYERGVAFDAISGTARISSGLVTLSPELQIVGPSGAFKLNGTTDLSAETLDMRLVVVLPLTQNLPLAALLMGAGAPIGGALFVLDKVLGDPLSKLTSATYSVTGTWDNPEVDLRRVFDTGE
ncbi:hypothetical protein MD273_04870 [Marinobacter pelagius]|uniref:YhdP family phospholipid transporter n=1 Tax=Marinobacter sp. C7 TaxID=2951363 RepID=UPI001EEF9D4B|nr:AsmA-like C-terminal region-containing protein [Marinobacter sp. C7]MCG7199059.1 hypothetical protein [Marinobacter sp. C7]